MIVNFSDAPGAETADKYLLSRSYMEHFNNGIKSQCDLCIYRIFITVQRFRNASRLLARFCPLYSGLQEEVSPAFLCEVKLRFTSLFRHDRQKPETYRAAGWWLSGPYGADMCGVTGLWLTDDLHSGPCWDRCPCDTDTPKKMSGNKAWNTLWGCMCLELQCRVSLGASTFCFYPHQMKCHSWQKQPWCSEQNGATAL